MGLLLRGSTRLRWSGGVRRPGAAGSRRARSWLAWGGGAGRAGGAGELSAEIVADVRATGVRVRLDSDEHAEAVSAAARELGLTANPAVLQHLSVVLESANPSAV